MSFVLQICSCLPHINQQQQQQGFIDELFEDYDDNLVGGDRDDDERGEDCISPWHEILMEVCARDITVA